MFHTLFIQCNFDHQNITKNSASSNKASFSPSTASKFAGKSLRMPACLQVLFMHLESSYPTQHWPKHSFKNGKNRNSWCAPTRITSCQDHAMQTSCHSVSTSCYSALTSCHAMPLAYHAMPVSYHTNSISRHSLSMCCDASIWHGTMSTSHGVMLA